VTNDIETLITAPYVKIDDELGGPRWLGRPPVLTDSELVCLAAATAGCVAGRHGLSARALVMASSAAVVCRGAEVAADAASAAEGLLVCQ
jgi:hypothetical protein